MKCHLHAASLEVEVQCFLHMQNLGHVYHIRCTLSRVAELGSLSSREKMAMKIFVKRMFTIFATNATFLRVIANLQI